MKLKTKLSKLRHEGHITDAEYAIIINVLNKFSTQPPKTEPCEDYISRAEVHDLLATWLSDHLTEETREALETIDGKIEDMQSVTPWSSWTPASQLPEPNTAVLLYVKYKSSGRWTYQLGMWNDSGNSWEDWRTTYDLEYEFEVIAWMELPEKYEEGEDE